MKYLNYLPFALLGGLMILHGIAHAPAVIGSWGLATFEDVSARPNLWLTDAGAGLMDVLGAIWLLAALSFVLAGIGVLRKLDWWPVAAALALVLSVPMTILWSEDAAIGLLLNAVLLAVMAGWFLVTNQHEEMPV